MAYTLPAVLSAKASSGAKEGVFLINHPNWSFSCGCFAYKYLPPLWSGTCTVGLSIPLVWVIHNDWNY